MYYAIFLSNDIVPPSFVLHKTFQDMGEWRHLCHYCVVYLKQELKYYACGGKAGKPSCTQEEKEPYSWYSQERGQNYASNSSQYYQYEKHEESWLCLDVWKKVHWKIYIYLNANQTHL